MMSSARSPLKHLPLRLRSLEKLLTSTLETARDTKILQVLTEGSVADVPGELTPFFQKIPFRAPLGLA